MAKIMTNERAGELRPAYVEIRGSKLNRCFAVAARVLMCVLAVMICIGLSNPAQTARLGRASLPGMAVAQQGLSELREAEQAMAETINALEQAAAALEAVGTQDGPAAADALAQARMAADALQTEYTAAKTIAERDLSAAAEILPAAAQALQVAADAYANLDENDPDALMAAESTMYAAMEPLWNLSAAVPALAEMADGASMALMNAMYYEPFEEGAPTKTETIIAAIASAQEIIQGAAAEVETLQAESEQAKEVVARLEPVVSSLDAALAGAETAQTPEALQAAAAALREAKAASSVANASVKLGQDKPLILWGWVCLLAAAAGLAGMVMSLGNNRMRKIGLPLMLGGNAAEIIVLLMLLGTHGKIAGNADALTQACSAAGGVPALVADALAKLSLEVPAALWVNMACAVLCAACALVTWITLPQELEERMQIDQTNILLRLIRVVVTVFGLMVFFPSLNPGRVSELININASLFTSATSYSTITNTMAYPLRRGMVEPWNFYVLMAGAIVVLLGIVICAAGACMSLGNNRMKRVGLLLPVGGAAVVLGGLGTIYYAYTLLEKAAAESTQAMNRLMPMIPNGLYIFGIGAILVLVLSAAAWLSLPRKVEDKMEMDEKFRLLLMFLPVLLLTFIFCYLPIYGWRFAFFDYKIGDELLLVDKVVDGAVVQQSNFTGLKWFTYLFENAATRADLVRVLRNTLIMSGLGIATSWLPIAFAVLLAEVRSSKFQRVVQTLTTIPNFISWVLVYAIAFAIFSTDGFINSFLRNVMGVSGANTDYLASADWIWVKMLLWGTWKGLGWSAIVYIAGIAGIDQQLYEAARVDGANRFHCIWHITIPGLIPTYMVMLLMSIAGMLSNGMEQYLVFENAINKDVIEVLDLYVYNIGIKSGLIPLSTVVGIFKSLIGVTLLFGANGISKAVRGESII